MDMIEQTIIILGISLEIFGAMECQGSLVAKIEKKQLAFFCLILVAGQTLALGGGDLLALFLSRQGAQAKDSFLGQAVAAAIFLFLGLRLFHMAWRNEGMMERREEKFEAGKFLARYIRSIVFTFLAGIALGFLSGNISYLILLSLISTVLVTVIGMYTGYRMGFEYKMRAYVLGGILLVAGGTDVILRYMA